MSCPSSRSRNGCSTYQSLELGDQLGATSDRELGVNPILQSAKPALLEPLRLERGKRLVEEIGEGRSSPDRQRVAQGLRRRRSVAGRSGIAPTAHQALEAAKVQLFGADAQPVSGRSANEPIRAEQAAQPRDIAVQRALRRRRRPVAPERLDKPVARDDLVRERAAARPARLAASALRAAAPTHRDEPRPARGSRTPCGPAKHLCKAIATPLQQGQSNRGRHEHEPHQPSVQPTSSSSQQSPLPQPRSDAVAVTTMLPRAQRPRSGGPAPRRAQRPRSGRSRSPRRSTARRSCRTASDGSRSPSCRARR